jgi:hypothetical protein
MFVFLSLLFSVSTFFNFLIFSSSCSLSAMSLYPQKELRLVSSSGYSSKMISSSLELLSSSSWVCWVMKKTYLPALSSSSLSSEEMSSSLE